MIQRIIEFSIRNRAFVILAGLLLAAWGVYSIYHTPIDAIPDISENQVIVFTEWMGHSPREIEDQITYPLSLSLQGLAGVRVVRSSSDFNFSMISMIFEDHVEFYAARRQVAERLTGAGIQLPPGVVPRVAPDAIATGQIFWYTVEGVGHDPGRLRAIQDWYVRPQLQSVPGVAEVASVGGYPLEYQVEVDPRLLRLRNVTLNDVAEAISRSNAAVGGQVIHKGNAEYVVRGAGLLGSEASGETSESDPQRVLRDLENVVVGPPGGPPFRLTDLAHVSLGSQFRRCVLEKDGSEVTGGVIMMRYGENPLEVTRRILAKLQELQTGLPSGVRVVPIYDRTPLIRGAVSTVTGTLVEAILTATICVVLILMHLRTSFVIALTLPLAVLASFVIMWSLRVLGIADIQTNIMSLAGIAISIGVLVDSSIVMAENAMFHLKNHFGDRPARGDLRDIILPACRTVGRPIFFAVVIMLLSFVPVFALGGIEGKMFRPLAFTKMFALVGTAVLAITLVPALCTVFIRGKLRHEEEGWLVRSVVRVYRPALHYLLDRPAVLVWFMGGTFIVGFAPLGIRWLFLATLFLALVAMGWVSRTWQTRLPGMLSLVLLALIASVYMKPLESEFMTPLDEGMVMDMPITVPRASITQSADDLKARDMIFCRFPEVSMVVGKAGRAETSADPAPLDMIETMIDLRPPALWPKRKLRKQDADRHTADVFDALVQRKIIAALNDPNDRVALLNDAVAEALPVYDALMRESAYQRNQEFQRELGIKLLRIGVENVGVMLHQNGSLSLPLSDSEIARLSEPAPADLAQVLGAGPTLQDVTRLARATARKMVELGMLQPDVDAFRWQPSPVQWLVTELDKLLGGTPPNFFTRLHNAMNAEYRALWHRHIQQLDNELFERGTGTFTRAILEAILARTTVTDNSVVEKLDETKRIRSQSGATGISAAHHHGSGGSAAVPALDPCPALDTLQSDLTARFANWVLLWRKDRADLIGFGGELDRVMQMPGWTNIPTMPIQNRVDMLSTGVNTAIGIRVLGRNLEDVVTASEDIAAIVKRLPGAVSVVADPVRGKGYLEIRVNREKAARLGVNAAEVSDLVEIAVGGKLVATTIEGRERHPVRVRYLRAFRDDEEVIKNLVIPCRRLSVESGVLLSAVADIAIVEGPATIKSENGLLRNYVRLNLHQRDALDFVAEAKRAVASRVHLPAGVYVEWTGQFEHDVRSSRTLTLLMIPVLAGILLTLYFTYRDWSDAMLIALAVPGALAGGVFFQWLFDYRISVAVRVGYIACIGMAASTGVIMVVYLREAVARAGGLEKMTLDQLRRAVMNGAVHRLRPKLLTEATTVIGLMPMLWATGVGSEVIRPMAAPVIGGILIADEVIDLFLPVLFYWVRRRRWERIHHNANRPSRIESKPSDSLGPSSNGIDSVVVSPKIDACVSTSSS